jgi:sulfoxide reductase catalytic subunit YedY
MKAGLKALALLGAFLVPFIAGFRWTLAKTRKIILPKSTKMGSLIQKNPADLDTRNLDPTPLEDFGTMGLTDHKEELGKWRLSVEGYVENPFAFSYDQLTSLPFIERDVLMICPGFFANHGRWKGISIRDLLKNARPKDGATHLTFHGPQSPYENLQRFPIADALTDKVFLAYQVNGRTLPERHGFPLRVVAEDYYGYDWIKYVYKVTVDRIVPESKDN